MPPKKAAAKPKPKQHAKPAARTTQTAKRAPTRVAPAKTAKRTPVQSITKAAAAAAAAQRAPSSKPKPKVALTARAAASSAPRSTTSTARAKSSVRASAAVKDAPLEEDELPHSSGEPHLTSSALMTPIEVSESESSEDIPLLSIHDDRAARATMEAASAASPLSSAPVSAVVMKEVLTTPRQQADAEDASESRDESPGMLAANSESRRSSRHWQLRLLSTTATQPLHDSNIVDGGKAEAATSAAKRLFTQPPRSISYSPSSASASSSVLLVDDAADRTIPMPPDGEEEEEEEEEARGEEDEGAAEAAEITSRHGGLLLRSATDDTPPPPSSLLLHLPQHVEAEEDEWRMMNTGTAQAWLAPSAPSANHSGREEEQEGKMHRGVSVTPSLEQQEQQQRGWVNGSPQSAPNGSTDTATRTAAIAASSSIGHLRMGSGGSLGLGRGRSPSLSPSFSAPAVPPTSLSGGGGGRLSFRWVKKVKADVEVPTSTADAFPSTPLPLQQQQQQPSFSFPSASATLSPQRQLCTSPGSDRAALGSRHHAPRSTSATPPTAAAAAGIRGEGERSDSNSSHGSPQRLRQREPPAWRSPQPANVPTSLKVSPPTVRSASTRESGGTQGVDTDAVRHEAVGVAGVPSVPVARRDARSPSNLSSYTVLTQTLPSNMSSMEHLSPPTTAPVVSVAAAVADASQVPQAPAQQQGTSSTSTAATPTFDAAAAPAHGAAPPSRPSTQLITKAAATRPTASPATMWICIDDDDTDTAEDEEGEEERDGHTLDGRPAREATDVDAPHGGDGEERARRVSPPPCRQHTEAFIDGENEEGGGVSANLQQRSRTSPPRRRPLEKRHPIAEILSPTFRPRRRPPHSSVSPTRARREHVEAAEGIGDASMPIVSAQDHRDPRRFFIKLDDDDDDDDSDRAGGLGEGSEVRPRKQPRLSASSVFSSTEAVAAAASPIDSPMRASSSAMCVGSLLRLPITASPNPHRASSYASIPIILDDDSDDDDEHGRQQQRQQLKVVDEEAAVKAVHGMQRSRIARERSSHRLSLQLMSASDTDSQVTSPVKPTVKDLFFPKRLDPEVRPSSPLYESIHAYQQHYQQQQQQEKERGEEEESSDVRHDVTAGESATQPREKRAGGWWSPSPQRSGAATLPESTAPKRGRAQSQGGTTTATASGGRGLPNWGRPADTLLRDFFPATFTRRNFMAAAQTVLSPLHFLDAGDFWQAFASADFVGEGSFGLVWRCRTVDGDLVAVKSCPILLRTRANIEDSFSTIREIATMRFLNEMQVPYILPLHSAFFVKTAEAMPPAAQEALEWRRQLRRKAESVVLEKEVRLLPKGRSTALSKHSANASRSKKTAAEAAETAAAGGGAGLAFEEQVAAEMQRQVAKETKEERARRARLQDVRLPRFLSITEDDLHQSDATAFLVMELCDGDVEGIPRSEGVSKGVAYCVSSALAAMHELGLLHLDLKPSNVLFAYEHGPSQSSPPFSSSPPSPRTGGAVGLHYTTTTTPAPAAMDAVKFYLSDFGNCRLVGPEPLAEVADSYGTYEYMDLPALQDAICGRPTDAFSLGATLFELLYGRRLYPRCANAKCAEEADHTRACFVEAAKKEAVLPPLPVTGGETWSCAAAAAAAAAATPAAGKGGGNSKLAASGGVAVVNPLQILTSALLARRWEARMTAAECRRYLIDAFHITQSQGEEEG